MRRVAKEEEEEEAREEVSEKRRGTSASFAAGSTASKRPGGDERERGEIGNEKKFRVTDRIKYNERIYGLKVLNIFILKRLMQPVVILSLLNTQRCQMFFRRQ